MKNVSNQFRNELFNGNRNFIKSADIKLKDRTVLHVDNSKFWQNGLKIEDSVSSSSSFDIGSAIIGQLTVTLNNIYDEYSEYDFTDAEISNIKVGLKLPDDTIESLSYGIYTVNETNYNGSIITLTAYDNMYKFDIPYSKSNLTYPATLRDIVMDACSVCNVQLGTASFDNDDFLVNERPSDDSITFRNVLLWVAQISCNYLKTDPYGKLLLEWYNTSIFENVKLISGGKYNPWDTDKSYDGGTFSPWTTGNINIDGGSFSDESFHNIYSWMSSPNITTDDVVITGIKVIDDVETEEGTEQVIYQSGEDGYVIEIEGNKLIQGKGEEICSFLGEKIIGLTFRPFSGNCLSDPTIEAGDLAIISDRKGNSYKTFITSNTFQPGNYQLISCDAETPLRNSVSRFSKSTQAWSESRKELKKQKTEFEKAMDELKNRIDNSSGLYMTSEEQPDGSIIYYMHDKPTLQESMIVWKMTAEAIAVSTDGGKTYNAGLAVDGTLIAKIMNTIGINFDWGVGGTLIIRDKSGKETVYMDAKTGTVRMNVESLTISGKTAEEIAGDAVNDFVDSVYDPAIKNLQNQIDGQIESWYYDYQPTLSNAPASSWTTETERQKHEGDLFYWKSKGYSYRFFKDGTSWKWQMVQDTDITKALAAANEAQDTADNKRRVFVSTPVPPYDIGDLWTQGSNGDIMRCQVARKFGNYVSSDWVKASKYTDNTKALEVQAQLEAVQGDLQNQIDGKIETYSQSTDPSASWSADEKSNHIGDLWYNGSTKETKRWSGTAWFKLQSDEAEKANELAQSKAQVFVSTPKPPYYIGDIWTQGASGDIMRCAVSKTSGSYVSSDWVKASKYTDNSALDAFVSGEFKETTEELKKQADSKAETWYQSSDPSTAWTTSDLKQLHIGDIWFNTSSSVQKSYRWNGSSWQEMKTTPPPEVFDEIDGKAQIFINTPKPPYSTGDLWFNSSTSDIMTCVTSRSSGNYTASDWQKRNKYTDDTAVKDLDAELDQEGVFNRLTNNGEVKGIYKEGNQLYILFTYARGGTLSLGGKNNGYGYLQIRDDNDKIIGEIDKKGIGLLGQLQISRVDSEGNTRWSILESESLIFFDKNKNKIGYVFMLENSENNKFLEIFGKDGILFKGNSYFSRIFLGSNDGNDSSLTWTSYDGKAISVDGGFYAYGNLGCSGKKYRIVDTINYEKRLLCAYETPSPYFGDIGCGVIDENGICVISFDDIFLETVNTESQYQVFLQKEGEGDIWVEEKKFNYFSVKGTPFLKFSWEIKAKQKDYESERLENFKEDPIVENIDYEIEAINMVFSYYKSLEEMFL